MTRKDWEQLETLCRRVLDEEPIPATHTITDAVRTTGAFAAAVQAHWEEANNA